MGLDVGVGVGAEVVGVAEGVEVGTYVESDAAARKATK
jgi:hypothetical protein